MRLIICTLLLLTVSLLPAPATPAQAVDWTRIVPSVRLATVPIQCSLHQRITCSAFSIDRAQGHYLTASHCLHIPQAEEEEEEDVPQIDGQDLEILYEDVDLDLAVVKITSRRPALKIRPNPVGLGTRVAVLGFARGRPTPSFRTAVVSILDLADNGSPFVGFDNALVGGMSGGPVVDYAGKVVGVATSSKAQTGYSLTPQFIYEHTKQFWAEQ